MFKKLKNEKIKGWLG